MDEELIFMTSLLRMISKTERVLMYYGMLPERQRQLLLDPYIRAMSELCCRQSRNFDGITTLQSVNEVFQAVEKKHADTKALLAGRQNLGRYKQWLEATFPTESGPMCQWPLAKGSSGKRNNLCERCHSENATCHLMTFSSKAGGQRHEYCDACYREVGGG